MLFYVATGLGERIFFQLKIELTPQPGFATVEFDRRKIEKYQDTIIPFHSD